MRIAVNGWFHDRLATGSGQYLDALAVVFATHRVRARVHRDRAPRRGGQRSGGAEGQGGEGQRGRGAEGTRNTQYAIRNTQYPPSKPTLPFDRINTNLAKLWFEQITFPRACRRLGADVAFVPYWGSPWWQPCPVVVTVHDLIPLLLPLYRGGVLQRAYTALVSRTARHAAAVLTDSEASKRATSSPTCGIPADRIHAIHLAADPRYRPVTDLDEFAAHPGEVQPARWTILALSRRFRSRGKTWGG